MSVENLFTMDLARQATVQSTKHSVLVSYDNAVTGLGSTLNVLDCSLTFNEGGTPHVTFQATCALPETQEELDALDPRQYPMVMVQMGYEYAGHVAETPLMAQLTLSSRTVSRPDNTMEIVAESSELRLSEYSRTSDWTVGTSYDPVTVINQIINYALPTVDEGGVFSIDPDQASRNNVTEEDALVAETGVDWASFMFDVADRGGDLWVYEDGLGVWKIKDRAKLGRSVHELHVGENGSIISSSTTMSRDEWANAVLVRYLWTNSSGNEVKKTGYSQMATGPYAVANGRKLMVVDRERSGSAATAKTAATSILKRTVSRGRSFTLSAISAYWLRPGDTVTVTLPTGSQERHIVVSVQFQMPQGQMNLTTRVPADGDIE
jgi:hypothetical protein